MKITRSKLFSIIRVINHLKILSYFKIYFEWILKCFRFFKFDDTPLRHFQRTNHRFAKNNTGGRAASLTKNNSMLYSHTWLLKFNFPPLKMDMPLESGKLYVNRIVRLIEYTSVFNYYKPLISGRILVIILFPSYVLHRISDNSFSSL